MSGRSPSGWQGPLRAAVAVLLVGFLVVWLVKPIGNPCPDLSRLPQGSTASSSPAFAPPGSRTCTYAAAGGTKATAKYMPWLDWIVLLLLAAAVAGAVRILSPAGRLAREDRPGRAALAPRSARMPRAGRAERAPRAERAERAPRADRPPRSEPSGSPPSSSADRATGRDPAERERARRERAERSRRPRS